MAAQSPEFFRLDDAAGASVFEAVRRGFQNNVATHQEGAETIFTTIGEYAIQQPPDQHWELTSPGQWRAAQARHSTQPTYRRTWATAEELRTRAGEGHFERQHMDALDEALVRDQRVATARNQLTIASESELRQLLYDYRIPLDQWRTESVHDLSIYLRSSDQTNTDNISLHDIGGQLWVASAQTMLANVYYTEADGTTYRLRETQKRHYDSTGVLGAPADLTMRSSLGEMGRCIDGDPERPFDAAVRCMKEEIGADYNTGDVLQIVSTGSLLRQNRRGHHSFKTLKTEDHTHYFNAWLSPAAVQHQGYTNIECDADGRRRVQIKLGWFKIESPPA